ncbi:MAG: DUF1707 and DUF2154 domain-containing protein [Gemmatimonadetes bacterium]|nr:DUF1707 and DUF2154 domain-containing protein [Gemmatimonadota bacterium]
MTSPNRPLPAVAVTDAQREAVAQALSAHFANDRLTIDTLDARMAMVYEATTVAQLEQALAGLDLAPRPDTDPGHPVLLADEQIVPPRSVMMAVMGGFEQKGSYVLPRQLKIIAFMGGGALDLREARFARGVTEVEIYAGMGGAEIIVPPGVRVELLGSAFMGGFAQSGQDESAFNPDAPVLRVSGFCFMGGVDIKVRGPTKKMLKRFEEAMQRTRFGRAALPPGSGRG